MAGGIEEQFEGRKEIFPGGIESRHRRDGINGPPEKVRHFLIARVSFNPSLLDPPLEL
jgi:hypothetical protein